MRVGMTGQEVGQVLAGFTGISEGEIQKPTPAA